MIACFRIHRDYLRYQPDWFFDIGEHLSDIELVELAAVEGHIFACFAKNSFLGCKLIISFLMLLVRAFNLPVFPIL